MGGVSVGCVWMIEVRQSDLLIVEFGVGLLPLRRLRHRHDLHSGDLVFRAIGRPVGIVSCDDIGTRFREMERGVNDTRLHALCHHGSEHSLPRSALNTHPIILLDAALFCIMRMDLQPIFAVPLAVFSAPRLRADVVLRQNTPSGQNQGEFARDFFIRRHILRDDERPLPRTNLSTCMIFSTQLWRRLIARPLHAAMFFNFFVGDALKARCQRSDLRHDLAWMHRSSSADPVHWPASCVTSQSARPALDGMTLRTREMRRSALVNVPSFSRKEDPAKRHARI